MHVVPSSFLVLFILLVADCSADTPPGRGPATEKSVKLVLPSQLVAVVGVETNIYFDNVALMLNPANYAFDVICPKGRHQSERWTWTPTEADIGEVPLQLEMRDDQNQLISRGETTIKVVAAKGKAPSLTVLLMGDSLTHASVYSQQLLDLAAAREMQLKLIGSHAPNSAPDVNRHEGYGGWTAQRFATYFAETARQGDYAKRGSPFLYKQPDGSTKLDFTQYCRDVNDGKFPDAVTIFLGPNDIFSFIDDTIAKGIETMLGHYDKLIEMIRSASPSTQVGVMLPVPPAASQDAFGSNYASTQTRWQYRRNQHFLVEAMIERYGNRQADGIHLVATHLNLDAVHNYPTETVAANAHSDQKIVRQNNGVHPSPAGYRQIGDTVFGWLRSLE